MGLLQKVFGNKKKEKASGGIRFNVPRVDVGELEQHPDAIRQISARELDGIVVHNVISGDYLREVVDKVEAWESEIVDHSDFGKVFGKTLIGTGNDLDLYFSQNASLENDLVRIFGKPFAEIVEPVLKRMAGGRAVSVPEMEGRGAYKGSTVRFLNPGKDEMQAHVGNEFITGLSQYKHISSLLSLKDQLSYFVVLQAPEEGGELVLFDLSWDDTPSHLVEDHGVTRVPEQRKAYLRNREREDLVLQSGDLLVFHGGSIWHRVNPVRGSRNRITIGGFAAFGLDDDRIYYWS